MIVQQDIRKDPDWDGKSVDSKTQRNEPNLESSMSFEEHLRIVSEALRTLLAVPVTWSNDKKFKRPWVWLDKLKDAYDDPEHLYTLLITKGIHQPITNPHMQLKLDYVDPTDGTEESITYHLDVGRS